MRQALIVIDVQNDYFENGKMELEAPQEALQQIKRVLTFFKTAELPIIYIQHIKEGTTADFFGRGTKGAQLHTDLEVDSSAIVIEKQFPNSFVKTKLEETLKSLQVEQVVITGMMTQMCVDSTTRASRELGYNPILLADATATKALSFGTNKVAAKDVQYAFLAALQSFAQVLSTTTYLNRFNK
ncbi:cysteine hydrolase family protein [Liquorilactobacillus satsumensis]|uniref:cysteine hydrolase family protein n=1 Tax=Liquorilactobacillus satsumensis TaxID=259059 RepID=UPI001E3F63E5|nr:cysteine hydrolase family protein [Liquorilactobacillus satsumensis]MCC7666890.1 cysteine hydrolase [Liquorilactobacillus satsumensis]MCP9356992.1 cysteine hydrolase [Liquorilactobacillus satsumensis]MCP9370939.1 cysteine hydrolase [Liquorilactobacillus satsumensis]